MAIGDDEVVAAPVDDAQAQPDDADERQDGRRAELEDALQAGVGGHEDQGDNGDDHQDDRHHHPPGQQPLAATGEELQALLRQQGGGRRGPHPPARLHLLRLVPGGVAQAVAGVAVVARSQVVDDDRVLLQQFDELRAGDDQQAAAVGAFHRRRMDAGHEEPQVVEVLAGHIGPRELLAGAAVLIERPGVEPPFLDDIEAVGHVALIGDDRVRLEGVLRGHARDGRLGGFAQVGEYRQRGDELLLGGHGGDFNTNGALVGDLPNRLPGASRGRFAKSAYWAIITSVVR